MGYIATTMAMYPEAMGLVLPGGSCSGSSQVISCLQMIRPEVAAKVAPYAVYVRALVQ